MIQNKVYFQEMALNNKFDPICRLCIEVQETFVRGAIQIKTFPGSFQARNMFDMSNESS